MIVMIEDVGQKFKNNSTKEIRRNSDVKKNLDEL